tara:strand:- start:213 stop:983 length:771 start_codon:yes stop_codon:yes gene_type:complete
MERNLKTKFLEKGKKLRKDFIKILLDGFKFHIGGTLSCLDICIVLFYGNFIDLKKKRKNFFILSKGHALACLFLTLIDQKLYSLSSLKKGYKNLKFGGQLDIYNSKYVDWNTGSLGHSIGVATGLAIKNPEKKIFVIVGDAEFEEGSIWEAIFYISEKKIKNILIIIDRNRMSASSIIKNKEIFDKKIINQLYFDVVRINGHNYEKIYKSFKKFKKKDKSTIIIADTIKGKGFKIFENNKKYSHEMPKNEILKNLI